MKSSAKTRPKAASKAVAKKETEVKRLPAEPKRNIRCRYCFVVDGYKTDENRCKHCGQKIYGLDQA